MPPEFLIGEVFQACPTGKRHGADLRLTEEIMSFYCIMVPLEELEVARERDLWASLFKLQTQKTTRKWLNK